MLMSIKRNDRKYTLITTHQYGKIESLSQGLIRQSREKKYVIIIGNFKCRVSDIEILTTIIETYGITRIKMFFNKC